MLIMTKLNIGAAQHFASNKIRWYSVSTEDKIAFENQCVHKISIRELKSSKEVYKSIILFYKIGNAGGAPLVEDRGSGCFFFYQINYIFSCKTN